MHQASDPISQVGVFADARNRSWCLLDMKLQVVVLPVEDVDRAKAFYRSIGFREIYDHSDGDDFRVVQLTPPGSEASIVFGTGVTVAAPGSIQGLVLVVRDIAIARVDLADRGVDVTGVFHDIDGVFYHVAPEYEVPGLDPARRDHRSFARFRDPDGNTWVLQEVRHLAPGATPRSESPWREQRYAGD
jgi:catechol 2,3-dioxygenase-like lactoylglutathione lyase family enzyme